MTFLPAGKYTLVTRAKGFKEARNTDLELGGGQELRLTHSLVLGEVTDTVTVTAETSIVNTANAEQTHNLNMLRMTELPTVNRDWRYLRLVVLQAVGRGDSPINRKRPIRCSPIS